MDDRGGRPAELTGLRLEAELGRGADTTVYRASRDGERYALKQAREDVGKSAAMVTAMSREAALLACVEHPGVLRTYAAGLHDDRPAVVVELIDGGSVADRLFRGPLDNPSVIRLAGELADALAAVHRVGLVHRDIKPQNIMLPPDRPATLIDFSLAIVGTRPRPVPADEDRAPVVGTFAYTSPEQSGMLRRPVDGRSDLYSLGVVLFECLAGFPPFAAADVGELLRLHTVAPPPDLRALRPDADPGLVEVVYRLLAKDPDDRYAGADELGADLARRFGHRPSANRGGWPMCGRDAEREVLLYRWRRARDSAAGAIAGGGAAVVRGPAGGGRSRRAAEVAAAAAADGVPVLRARGARDESVPLAAVRAAVEHHLDRVRALPADERAAAEERLRAAAAAAGAGPLRNLSPRLAELLSGVPGVSAEGRGDRFFLVVAGFLAELASRHGGALLEFDDAQWLDAATRRVLALLAPDLRDTPLLIVLTETDDTPAPLAADLGPALDTEVTAGPLDGPATAALIASRLPGAEVPAELAAHVYTRTGGLPLVVVEYLRQLVDAGLLVPHWGTWSLDEAGVDGLSFAADAEELFLVRLGELPEEHRPALAVAAAVGGRFRLDVVLDVATAACDLPAERVVDAVDAAVAARVVEAREGGRYGFVHPGLPDALLADVPADALRRLHLAIAGALADLPDRLRDSGHVYAVARHIGLAGPDADPSARYAAALAAGRQALRDQVPADAVTHLEQARDAVTPPATDLLHPLAVAYLGSGRFGDARESLDRALSGESDPRRRAELRTTLIELHHTRWADDAALAEAGAALAELGWPLPRRRLALLASTLAVAALGGLVGRLGRLLPPPRKRRRAFLAASAAVLDAGAYAAANAMRVREAAVFALRALYPVNRLGLCPEYVRVHAMLGYVAAMIRLRRRAEKAFARAGAAATALNDPALTAYVDWVRGGALLFGGYDDGSTWERAVTRHARWLAPAQHMTGLATTGIRQVVRGYTREAQAVLERGLALLPDAEQALGTSFAMLTVMVPAQQGRPGDAAAALAAMRASFPPGTGTPTQRANIATAAACAVVEQGDFGAPFDEVVAEFEALGLRRSELMAQHAWFYVYRVHGRMAQVRFAPDDERPARLAAAEAAVRELGRVARTPLSKAAYRLARAALLQQTGRTQKAIKLVDRIDRDARVLDAPQVSFEVARIRARAMRQLGLTAETDRQARNAYLLASRHGWEHRRRQVRAEFGVDDASSSLFTHAVDRGDQTRSNRRLEALQQVSAAASTVLDPQRLSQVALDETLRIFGAERALLFLVDERGELIPFVGRDATGNDVETATGYGSTLLHRVVESGRALVVTGTEQGAALGSQSVVAHGLRSIMVAPVQFKGELRGVVYLDSRVAKGIFTEDDVAVLTAVTSHVAVSLETARAAQLDLAVRTARRAQGLAESLRASLAELSRVLDPAEVLHRLFTTLTGQLGAPAGWLLQGAGAELSVVATSGEADGAVRGHLIPLTDAALAALCDAPSPTVLTVADGPAALRDLLAGHGGTALVVPLSARDGRVGLVVLGGTAFDDAGREIAAAFAGQGMSAYDNAVLFSRVQELAITDELTGQHNRRHFYSLAGTLVAAAARNGRDLVAAMLDIDRFKNINDTYGHGVGDDVIREVAARLRACLRHADVLGRYGGEEFAVILPDSDGPEADLAQRMRLAIADEPVPTRAGPVPVTISVGLARLLPAGDALDQLLARADHALYRAKEAGRDRVVADDPAVPLRTAELGAD